MNHHALKEAMRRRRGKGLNFDAMMGHADEESKDLAPEVKDDRALEEKELVGQPKVPHDMDKEVSDAIMEEHEEGMPGEDEMVAEEEGKEPLVDNPAQQEVHDELSHSDHLPLHKKILKRAAELRAGKGKLVRKEASHDEEEA